MLAGASASPHYCEWSAGRTSRQIEKGKSSLSRYDLLCASALCTENAFSGIRPAEDVRSLLQEGRFQAEAATMGLLSSCLSAPSYNRACVCRCQAWKEKA